MVLARSRRETLRFLSSVSTVCLAGCLSRSPATGDAADTTRSSGATTVDPERDLSFSVTVLESFTEEHPGRVRITLTNLRAEPLAMNVSRGIEGPMSVVRGTRTNGGAALIILGDTPDQSRATPPGAPCESGENAIPDTPTDGCWKPTCEIARITSHYAISIPAERSLDWEYVVLDGFNETCLPEGTYVFEETTPITTLQTADTPPTTPPGGWSNLLTKRVVLTLASDGTLTADEQLRIQPHGNGTSESSQNPTPALTA